MDSTAYLVRANAAYVELPLQTSPARQADVQENHPISSHRKFQTGLVLARLGFRCFLKHRSHTRVRHVCFQGDASSRNRFRSGIGQLEKDRSRPDLRRFGRDFVLNRHCRRRIDRPGAPGREKSGDAGEREKT
jgi:hypothetical protein